MSARAQLRRVVQRLFHSQVIVHDVALGHVSYHAFVRVHVLVIVVCVVVDLAACSGAHSVDAVEGSGFSRTAPAYDRHKFSRPDAHGNVRDKRYLAAPVFVGDLFAHVRRVDLDACGGGGAEQFVFIIDVRRARDRDSVVIAEFASLDLAVVDICTAQTVRVLDKAVLSVKNDKTVPFGNERIGNDDVAFCSAADDGYRLLGEVEGGGVFGRADLPDKGDLGDHPILFFAFAAQDQRSVYAQNRFFEGLFPQEQFAFSVFGSQILGVPHSVFQKQFCLFFLYERRADADVRAALAADRQ